MLLSTMSYMEIHREIVNDFRDVYAAIMKEFAEFQKKAQKAKRYRKYYKIANQYAYYK